MVQIECLQEFTLRHTILDESYERASNRGLLKINLSKVVSQYEQVGDRFQNNMS